MSGYGAAPNNNAQMWAQRLGGPNWSQEQGAPFGLSLKMPMWVRQPSLFRTNRKRLNAVPMIVNVLVPWLVFCVVFALVSFSVHYNSPATCWGCIALVFFLSVGTSGLLFQMARVRQERETADEYEPMWYGFVCITCLLAIVLGIILGFHNYDLRMDKVYSFSNLATYRDVDPASYVGQQLVDAGRVQFNNNTYLDISKSMGFKDSDVYCVAPIVSDKTSSQSYQDFWAVGKNCCSGVSADYHCAGFDDSRNRGGLRLMDDASRPFYRLAVQQAEATYKIKTHKPLFFVWGEDPIKYTDNLQSSAHQMYVAGIAAAFCVQLFLVATATLVFSKIFPTR